MRVGRLAGATIFGLAFMTAMSITGAAEAATDPIVNPTFTGPAGTNQTLPGGSNFGGTTSTNGWQVLGGGVNWYVGSTVAYRTASPDGSGVVDLNGSSPGGIQQTNMTLAAGQQYQLTIEYRANAEASSFCQSATSATNPTPDTKAASVYFSPVSGSTTAFLTTLSDTEPQGTPASAVAWKTYSTTVNGDGSTVWALQMDSASNGTCGLYIGYAALTPIVPTPLLDTTVALGVGGGLALVAGSTLAIYRRRRRSVA